MLFEGDLPKFFHGMDVFRGLEILKSGSLDAPTLHEPDGVYTGKSMEAVNFYDQGCVVEVISGGKSRSGGVNSGAMSRHLSLCHRNLKIHQPQRPLATQQDARLCLALRDI